MSRMQNWNIFSSVKKKRFLALTSLVAVGYFSSCHLVVLCRPENAIHEEFWNKIDQVWLSIRLLLKDVGGKRYKISFAVPGSIPQCKSVAQSGTTHRSSENFVLLACFSPCYFFLWGLRGQQLRWDILYVINTSLPGTLTNSLRADVATEFTVFTCFRIWIATLDTKENNWAFRPHWAF